MEDEEEAELEEEEARELEQKFARRQLGTNADRYAEPEPELDSDGACLPPINIIVYNNYHLLQGNLSLSQKSTSLRSWRSNANLRLSLSRLWLHLPKTMMI